MPRRRPLRSGDVVDAARLRGAQSEASWAATVVQLARLCGWWVLTLPRYVQRCACGREVRWEVPAGWPDFFGLRAGAKAGRAIAIEFKSDTGRLEVEQRAVLELLAEAGVDVFVAKPGDFDAVRELLE